MTVVTLSRDRRRWRVGLTGEREVTCEGSNAFPCHGRDFRNRLLSTLRRASTYRHFSFDTAASLEPGHDYIKTLIR
jgi:hypothetical protein